MKLFADESVDGPVVARLRRDGHEVTYAAELAPSTADDVLLAMANQQAALFVTADKDFGELVFRQQRAHGGVVLLRLAGIMPSAKADLVATVFAQHATQMARAFCVVSRRAVRIRKA